tara:strand:- start:245 stop:1669 length:1425 start_codon:yes stop_codon:yes gene_type:complete
MPRPDGGLITETNRQYYAGAQEQYITAAGVGQTMTSTFDTNLVFGSSDPLNGLYGLNNFVLYTSPNALTWTELTPASTAQTATATENNAASNTVQLAAANASILAGMTLYGAGITGNPTGRKVVSVDQATFIVTLDGTVTIPGAATTPVLFQFDSPFTMVGNIITITASLLLNSYLKIQLKETPIQENYGSYEYTRLNDVIDNFLLIYVGAGKLIPSINRTDVIFHAKRGLQEFSYDTLKSIKSQELTINNSLSVIIPQDYVNYVRLSWTDSSGVQHTILPANTLTTNPYSSPAQDNLGVPTQDSFNSNITATSQIEAAWASNDPRRISGAFTNQENISSSVLNPGGFYELALGQRYGLNPETSQRNGWFTINEREGTFSFSSDLANRLIALEYVSDGNAYELDARIPKMAEDALYAHISHGVLASLSQTPEYIVQRYKKERSSKLRNAKIRLSNIKLDQIVQVMRQQSKWLKY